MSLAIESSAFNNGSTIPAKYTCEGDDISPPLSWSGMPDSTRSLVLIIDDPDAPDPETPKMTWVHWVVYNISKDMPALPENAPNTASAAQFEQGLNDWHRSGYGGPCPPIGRHRYFHKLYALDTVLEGLSSPNKADIEKAMQGHIIAQAELVGTYQKQP